MYGNYSSSSSGSHRSHAPSTQPQYRQVVKRHNSPWDENKELRNASADARARLGPNASSGRIQLETNRIYGTNYENHVGRALNRDPRYTQVTDQVRLVPTPSNGGYSAQQLRGLNGQSGATLRSDFVAHKRGEGYHNMECKSSSTAGYTANQSRMIGDIYQQGATVVSGRGSYYGGQDLGSVRTTTVRPHNEDAIFKETRYVPVAPRPPEHPIYGRR